MTRSKKGAKDSAKPKKTFSQRFWEEVRGYAEALAVAFLVVTFLFNTVGVVGSSMRPNLDGGTGVLPSALFTGDRVFIPKYDNWLRRMNVLPNFKRGEVVVVREPKNAPTAIFLDRRRPFFIKRLIALPGDRVRVEGGEVYVNGFKMDQDYITGTGEIIPDPINFPVIVVEDGEVTQFQGLSPGTYNRGVSGLQPVSVDNDDVQLYYGGVLDNLAPLPDDVVEGEPFVHDMIVPDKHYFIMGDNRSPGGSEDSRFFGPIPIITVAGKATAVIWPPRREGSLNWRVMRPPEAFDAIPEP